jgi:sterol O-acyltransferase
MDPKIHISDPPPPLNGSLRKDNQAVAIENGSSDDTSGLPRTPDRLIHPTRVSVEPVGDDWSADPSSISDEEDYDALKIDRSAVVEGSTGGGLEPRDQHPSMISSTRSIPRSPAPIQAPPPIDTDMANRAARRQSIQVILERTNKKGRYILTADDPEIREILRSGIERESANMDSQKSRMRFRDLVFTRRFTAFDRQNPVGAESPFHGFFTLFWIAMSLLLLKVAAQNWKTYGSVLGSAELLHIMFDRDLLVLGFIDGVMCAATAFGLLLQKLILKGYLSWARSGWIIQNIWQTLYLFAVVGWTWYRDWPWTHTIFIVLHGLVFVMKQHSYAFYNGYCKHTRRSLLRWS